MQQQTQNTEEKGLQRSIVLNIVASAGRPIRTDEVRLQAFKQSVSCADVYLRMLFADNKVYRFWEVQKDEKNNLKKINKTKSWCTPEIFESEVKPNLNIKYVI